MKWAKDMNRNHTEEDTDMANKHMRKFFFKYFISLFMRDRVTSCKIHPRRQKKQKQE